MAYTRRRLLSAAAGVAGVGALAGCAGEATNAATGRGRTAQASFFVFGDLAATVAGEAATAETLVPIGQHGHGWEPGPSVREDIRAATLLLHNMPGFQPWVDDIADSLAADGVDTTTVDVSADVDLIAAGGSHDEETDDHDDHEEDSHNETSHDGSTNETHEEATRHDEQSDEDHDHGDGMDPHFWMDPRRVQTAVGTIRDAFIEADPDNEAAYRDNAATLNDQLESLDEEIQSVVSAGSTDVVLLAGHDAFSYLGDRYGLTIESLTGVGPDDQPSPQDIRRAQTVIDEHDLTDICAEPLESQRAAERLVADTDAETVRPLTAMPGLTDEWADNDWGYIEIMENVTLPTLRQVLDAE